jgi:hypothetical protein
VLSLNSSVVDIFNTCMLQNKERAFYPRKLFIPRQSYSRSKKLFIYMIFKQGTLFIYSFNNTYKLKKINL